MLHVAQEEWHCRQFEPLTKKPASVQVPQAEVCGLK